jgi:hypothetical protein
MNKTPGCPPDFYGCLPIPAACECALASCYAVCSVINGEVTCESNMAC